MSDENTRSCVCTERDSLRQAELAWNGTLFPEPGITPCSSTVTQYTALITDLNIHAYSLQVHRPSSHSINCDWYHESLNIINYLVCCSWHQTIHRTWSRLYVRWCVLLCNLKSNHLLYCNAKILQSSPRVRVTLTGNRREVRALSPLATFLGHESLESAQLQLQRTQS